MRCTLARPRCLLNFWLWAELAMLNVWMCLVWNLQLGDLFLSLQVAWIILNLLQSSRIILQNTNFHESGLLTLQVWIVLYYDSWCLLPLCPPQEPWGSPPAASATPRRPQAATYFSNRSRAKCAKPHTGKDGRKATLRIKEPFLFRGTVPTS